MNRREFTKTLGLTAVATSCGVSFGRTRGLSSATVSQVAITMDDFSWAQNAVRLTGAERNRAILETLSAHSLKATLFVIGRNVESAEGKSLLSKWNDAGHTIGNHTYSHRNYAGSAMTVAEYEQDILRAQSLLKDFPRFRKYFRFPMLKEGETVTKRDAMRAFLTQHGYRIGHVTIDDSDWIVDQRLTKRLADNPSGDLKPYRDYYLEHMWDRAQYYDDLAHKVLGRSIKHTVLTHFNLLNALFLGDLIEMFKSNGWQLIDSEEAFADPVFLKQPKLLPAGESIVWSLAKATGKIDKNLRYPAEDGEYEMARMDKLGL